jgi:hypothetical protein
VRVAIVRLPDSRTASERRQVLRAAIRQLERAELYVAAVAYMGLDEVEALRAVTRVRTDLDNLRRYLVDARSRISV